MTVPTLVEPIPGGFRTGTGGSPPESVADIDQETWDGFLAAMQMNRLLATAEEVGAEAARDILLVAGLIEPDAAEVAVLPAGGPEPWSGGRR